MSGGNWSTKDYGSKAKVSSKLPSSPAKYYSKPDIKSVPSEIAADEAGFFPAWASESGAYHLFANLDSETMPMTGGSAAVLDCGFSMNLPLGYALRIAGAPGLHLTLLDGERIKVHCVNLGGDLVLLHKQKIGKIWIEPVFLLG